MSFDPLTNKLQAFFQTDKFEILPLTDGTSPRKYYRLHFKEKLYFPETRIVLMTIPVEEIKILTDYMHIDFYLTRMGIPTPKVYEMKRQFGWIFLEYQDIPTLNDYLSRQPEKTSEVITNLIDFLILMQDRCQFEENCPAFQRFFDAERYRYEFEFYVREQLLSRYSNNDLSHMLEVFNSFSTEISGTLDIDTKVFIHGDFRSCNIFYNNSSKDMPFKIIDFQGAKSGSPIYDLVSCLWDSYIPITEDTRKHLSEKFFNHLTKSGTSLNKKEFQKLVDYTVIQRKLRDAGGFAYNSFRTNDEKFTSYIHPAIEMAIGKMRGYNSLNEMRSIFVHLGEN